MPLRLGVFGGTFDPPHIGHLVTAVNVRHQLALDRVLLVVANVPWQKEGSRPISDAEDRYAMVEAAAAGLAGVEASRIEIDRGGPSYTADTLAELHERYPGSELVVILGSDAAALLPTWKRIDEVRRAATIAVVHRPGAVPPPPLPGFAWIDVEVPHLDVSSTDLRARVGDGRPLEVLLAPGVIDRIRARHLYRAAA